jgi:hypothetical protein
MNLLQVKIDDNLKKTIQEKADTYGITMSSLVRIVLIRSFLPKKTGNVFNADRDNKGKGIKIEDLIDSL